MTNTAVVLFTAPISGGGKNACGDAASSLLHLCTICCRIAFHAPSCSTGAGENDQAAAPLKQRRQSNPIMWRSSLFTAVLSLDVVASIAHANDSIDVANRCGFLVGHTYRRGVTAKSLEKSAKLVHSLTAALATSKEERVAADTEFAERFFVSAAAKDLGGPLPSCDMIRQEVMRLDRYRRAPPKFGEEPEASKKAAPQPEPAKAQARSLWLTSQRGGPRLRYAARL